MEYRPVRVPMNRGPRQLSADGFGSATSASVDARRPRQEPLKVFFEFAAGCGQGVFDPRRNLVVVVSIDETLVTQLLESA